MRALYVCADAGVPVFGTKGAAIHVREVIRALRRRGVDCRLAAARRGGSAPADLAGVPLITVPRPTAEDPATRERQALAANDRLAGIVAGCGELDVVYERYSLWSHGAVEAAAERGTPVILEVNAPLLDEQARRRTLHDREAAAVSTERAFAAASGIVAVSDEVARWVSRWPGASHKVHVVPNGVDPRRFRPGQRRSLGPFVVAFVGSLKPWHGVDAVLDAIALLGGTRAGFRLVLIGDGPERDRLARQAAVLGIADAVHAAGAIAQEHVAALLREVDAAVVPYPARSETYFSPLKLFEYLACGLPVVASDVGQVRQVLTDGVHALLHAPGDVPAMAAALRQLRGDRQLCQELGRAGRALVLERHTWDHVAGRILELVRATAAVA